MKISLAKGLPENPGIAIVAVSGCALDGIAVERGLQLLRERGFVVHNYYDHAQIYQRFGATDVQRLDQLHAAIDNPDVQIVMALRGSYGLSRLLPHIDYKKIAESKKYLVGHSDFNALQLAMLAKTDTSSFCGPMLCDDFSREDLSTYTHQQFFDCIKNTQHEIYFEDAESADLGVSGRLWGGNLAMLCHLVGTEYFPRIDDGILFVEDIAEHPFRVERMMLQLHFSGVLQRQKAIVFGNFSAYKLAAHDNGYDFEQMIRYLRSVLSVPIITGLPFGHIKEKASLVMGSDAQLLVSAGQVRLAMAY
ncbi:MAG: LD-carboxypeptidase [Burkholderiales bacterium]|nr:LD-carboxypeptidase [Burkholderiales bacterium]